MTHVNHNVIEILQFSYENENSTSRWSGGVPRASEFADHLYVETRLDSHLVPDILDDQFDLVILTGNPGDGKTAFLNRLNLTGRTKSGRPIDIHHDATQPQGSDRSALAEDWLTFYLRDLTDEDWNPITSCVRVIGINEGMLVRTLLNPHGHFARRLRPILRHPKVGHDFRVLLVNLNDRTLVRLPFGQESNLLGRILDRLTDPKIWENGLNGDGCASCPAERVCPILSNAKMLRLSAPRRRLELLFATAQFERRRHMSIRDALAALAYLIVGHEDMFRRGEAGTGRPMHPCEYVQDKVSARRWAHLYRRLFYHGVFYTGDIYEGYFRELGEEEGKNRLYGNANRFISDELGKIDPATVSSEHLDSIELEVVSNPVVVLNQETSPWMVDLTELEREFFRTRVSSKLAEVDEILATDIVSVPEFQNLRESFLRIAYFTARAAKRRAFFSIRGWQFLRPLPMRVWKNS